MVYDWYRIFNLTEFLALGLYSKVYTFNFQDIGLRDVLVTSGKTTAITYEDSMLSLNLNGKNPFQFEGKAVYVAENNDVYLGILVNES